LSNSENEQDAINRRREPREPVKWDAVIIVDDVSYEAKISNVSLAGTLARTDAPLVNGTELILQIPKLGEFAGIVVWVDQPCYGLALMVGPDLNLKHFAVGSGADLSDRPQPGSGDDWV
jgi:PilZ domain